ncbi:iron-sulfur protein, partial [Streptomyces sp. 8N706]
MTVLHRLVKRLEHAEGLDTVARPLAALVGRAVRPRPVRNLLSGTHLGHPLHPVLTDVPIGAWSMALLLDSVGGRRAAPAADLLTGVGIASAVPTAASGWKDLSDTLGAPRHVGVVHTG